MQIYDIEDEFTAELRTNPAFISLQMAMETDGNTSIDGNGPEVEQQTATPSGCAVAPRHKVQLQRKLGAMASATSSGLQQSVLRLQKEVLMLERRKLWVELKKLKTVNMPTKVLVLKEASTQMEENTSFWKTYTSL